MSERSAKLRDSLLAELADIALEALKTSGGVYPTPDDYDKLKEAIMEALRGNVRL